MTDGLIRTVTIGSTTTHAMSPASVATPLLLDTYSGASVAYSLRKLRNAYSGSAVRIRRSSDNAEANIGFSGTDFDAAAAATHISGGTGFIVTWYDQSGNGADVTQATAANQPTYSASGLESKPTVSTDGSKVLSKASVTLGSGTQGTLFAVLIQAGSSTQNRLCYFGDIEGGSADGLNIWSTHFDTIYWDFGNETANGRINVAQPTGWDDNSHVVELYRDSGDTQGITVDGVSLVTGSRTQDYTATAQFNLLSQNEFGNGLSGQLSEFIFWGTDLGSTNRAAARTAINTYYGAF